MSKLHKQNIQLNSKSHCVARDYKQATVTDGPPEPGLKQSLSRVNCLSDPANNG